VSLPDLHARKRDLKQQLKQYDMNFARRHGRMPVKAEKEPIRHLYEAYNALKNQITQIEQDGSQGSAPMQAPVSPTVSPPGQQQQRVVSPPGSDTVQSGGDSSSASPVPPQARRRVPRAAAPQVSAASSSTGLAKAPSPAVAAASAGPPAPDLASLQAEKAQLHQMLRSYEKDFFKEHNRQVSSFADIRPVASQYRRYKEIKKAIAVYKSPDGS
jgi:hypothetical protein